MNFLRRKVRQVTWAKPVEAASNWWLAQTPLRTEPCIFAPEDPSPLKETAKIPSWQKSWPVHQINHCCKSSFLTFSGTSPASGSFHPTCQVDPGGWYQLGSTAINQPSLGFAQEPFQGTRTCWPLPQRCHGTMFVSSHTGRLLRRTMVSTTDLRAVQTEYVTFPLNHCSRGTITDMAGRNQLNYFFGW